MPTSSPSSAQLIHTEGDWEWCVLTTPDRGPLLFPHHGAFIHPGAHRGGCWGMTGMSPSGLMPPSYSRACIQARDGGKTLLSPVLSLWLPGRGRGPCHRVPSPALVPSGGLWPHALSCPTGIDRSSL